ncbi:MAG: hypothetical protein CSA32_02130 [Desulfobulbus propionicus]|nr:MAG: hypothetical protein CSA32_02130 [Desulfobulbus propionicus]
MNASRSGAKERRENKRYKLKDGTFAFFGATPCRVLDISKGGIAVTYVDFKENPELSHPFRLSLFSTANESYLAPLAGELVEEVASFPASFFSVLQMKRLSIRFDQLSPEQKEQLDMFIAKNSAGEA